ncbi:hypothetical protein Agub_g7039 [Astrephomene gubernaculifera]|uniref:3'-5' exonuclease domain-containing protein n=1 Tax=Astrephomene gubernaculifera TaxID=47775 RepID=A0AAD3DTM8_9CHLO|nr:hypothetical protein Agub_g7039 [Astrephomene gubernaculifera]
MTTTMRMPRTHPNQHSNAVAQSDGAASSTSIQRKARKSYQGHGRRPFQYKPHGNVLPAVACVGMLAAYAGFRIALLRRRMGLPGLPSLWSRASCMLASIAGHLHQPTTNRTSSHEKGEGVSIGAGHAVYFVPLPPRLPADQIAAAPESAVAAAATSAVAPGVAAVAETTVTGEEAATAAAEPPLEVRVVDLRRVTGAEELAAALSGLPGTQPWGCCGGQDGEGKPEQESLREAGTGGKERSGSDRGNGRRPGSDEELLKQQQQHQQQQQGCRVMTQQGGGKEEEEEQEEEEEEVVVLGLDAEWEPELLPGVRHRISVIQLSTANRCWVLQPGDSSNEAPNVAASSSSSSAAPVVTAAASKEAAAAETATPQSPPAPPPGGGGTLPAEVVRLMSDPRVIKAGVGIQEDVRRLERDFGVQVRGAVDIRLLAQRVAPASLAAGSSLRALTASLLARQLDKAPQRSHWAARQLDAAQIAYAAADAWLSRQLLVRLYDMYCEQQRQQQQLMPLSSVRQEHGQEQEQAGQEQQPLSLHEFVAPFLDVFSGFKTKRVEKVLPGSAAAAAAAKAATAIGKAATAAAMGASSSGLSAAKAPAASAGVAAAVTSTATAAFRDGAVLRNGVASLSSLNTSNSDSSNGDGAGCGGPSSAQQQQQQQRRKERKLPTRKSVLYENCRLLAPDGAVLCTCGAKKVRWYVERGLAHVVSEHPTTIQLVFEPRGRGHADDEYYLSDKENRCCVCGSGGEYLRHSVVPHCYRQHFPPSMKSHLSHDIVLMCPPCHKTCSVCDQRRMEQLGRQFSAPLGPATAAKFRHDSGLGAVRSAGRALSNPKVVIPPDRRAELEQQLLQHFGVAQLSPELIREAANVDPRQEDDTWRSHAEIVVSTLRERGGRGQLEEFVRGWRRHFLSTMRPRHMPPHWRVDARVANSAAPEEEQEEGEGEEGEDDAQGEGDDGKEEEEEQQKAVGEEGEE